MKKIKIYILLIAIYLLLSNSLYADIIYSNSKTEKIVDGVEYLETDILNQYGYLRARALIISSDDPTLNLETLRNKSSFRKPETVTNMMKENTLGAINASFFFPINKGTESIGTEINNGEITYGFGDQYNQHLGAVCNFSRRNNKYLFDYINLNTTIVNQRGEVLKIKGFNSSALSEDLMLFNNTVFSNTSQIKNLYDMTMFFIKDNTVQSIVNEDIEIPNNALILAYSNAKKDWFENLIKVGDILAINVDTNIDLKNTQMSIAGGGLFLRDREFVNEGLSVGPNQKHPRSAIGMDNTKNKIILLTVDGRGSSVGANSKDMAEIMLLHGADNALHFDGGGSTTMAVKNPYDQKTYVKNIVSDGSQRRVINALGISANRNDSDKYNINIKSDKNTTFIYNPINFQIAITDANGNNVNYNPSDLKLTSNLQGTFNSNSYLPSVAGKATIIVEYKGASASLDAYITDKLMDIKVSPKLISKNTTLEINGTDIYGNTVYINPSLLNFAVSEDIASINGLTITPGTSEGICSISYQNINEYVCIVRDENNPSIAAVEEKPFDYFEEKKTNEEAYKIGVFANTSGRNCLLDEIVMEKVYNKVNELNTAVFIGGIDVDQNKLNNNCTLQNNTYSSYELAGASFINLASNKGSFQKANNMQAVNLSKAIDNAKDDTIIISSNICIADYLDKSFSNESTVYHNILADYAKNKGKKILYISPSSEKNEFKIIDGVRYIKTSGLFSKNYIDKNDIYEKYSMLVIHIKNDKITYSIENLYK